DQTQLEEQTDDGWQPIGGSDSLNLGSLSLPLDLEQPTPKPGEHEVALQDEDTLPKGATAKTPGSLQVPIQSSASICPIKTNLESITFYLVPKLSHHYLLGELSQRLRRWVPIICKTFGWKLGTLSVRPNYIKWSLRDFPESAVPGMLKLFRNESSASIFHDFPNLCSENRSTDYWSPSYLVDKDNQQFSTRSLMALIPADRKTT
ncbi:MAG: transposase, partial [Chloroflexota bacterium]